MSVRGGQFRQQGCRGIREKVALAGEGERSGNDYACGESRNDDTFREHGEARTFCSVAGWVFVFIPVFCPLQMETLCAPKKAPAP